MTTFDINEVSIPQTLAELHLVPPTWTWRPGQRDLVQRIVSSKKKVVLLEAECGTGKSIVLMAAAKLSGKRTITLIQTVQLQEQYMRDFSQHLAMMMGRSHFTCNLTGNNADRAPCTVGVKCSLRGSFRPNGQVTTLPECHYYERKLENIQSQLTIQNYAYWMAETRSEGSAFQKAEWIICDEAHELDAICMAAGTIEIRGSHTRDLDLAYPKITTLNEARSWAREMQKVISVKIGEAENSLDGMGLPVGDFDTGVSAASYNNLRITSAYDTAVNIIHSGKRLIDACDAILAIELDKDGEWVVDRDTTHTLTKLKPIYGSYGFKKILDAATEKIILSSAFLGVDLLVKTLGLDPNDIDIIRAPKVFDRTNSKIWFCPVAKFNYNTTPKTWSAVAGTIAHLAATEFAGKSGIVHVPSLRLRDLLLTYLSADPSLNIITYEGTDVARVTGALNKDRALALFKQQTDSGQQAILLGQSVSTGVDLPGVPKWQVIVKLPYMPLDDPAVIKRKEVDKNYYAYYTICQMVQAAGRVKRSQDHDGPTIILDEGFSWFYAAHSSAFPAWFRESYVKSGWRKYHLAHRVATGLGIRAGFRVPDAV